MQSHSTNCLAKWIHRDLLSRGKGVRATDAQEQPFFFTNLISTCVHYSNMLIEALIAKTS